MKDGNALDRAQELKARTKLFALRVLKVFRAIPKSEEGRVMGRQLLRSGTSVGANYRAVCRARSRKEFISKLNVVVEEADETVFWLELLIEGEVLPVRKLEKLIAEANELLAILAASVRTAKTAKKRGLSMN